MSVSSRKEIQTAAIARTRQSITQIGDEVDDMINQTLNEINDPGWAFPRKDFTHNWRFLRRKLPQFTASAEDKVLDSDVDRIALVRQTTSPIKLVQVPDDRFYELIPNPTATGNPRWYRLWDYEGVATRLTTADTVDIVSSSTSDAGDSELSVTVAGYVSGVWRTETYALNGTTKVTGSLTFDARNVYVSKQKDTTGTITASENSGATTLTTLAPDERAPKFKIMSFYPIPSSTPIDIEYFTRMPLLENDSDVPIFDRKWHYVVFLGTVAKIYQYLNKETSFITQQGLYSAAVRAMVAADSHEPDLINHMRPRIFKPHNIRLIRSEDAIA